RLTALRLVAIVAGADKPDKRNTVWSQLSVIDFQDGEEGLLGNLDAAYALHSFFAFLLLFEELAFSSYVSAIPFGEDVLAQRFDGLSCNDLISYGGLYSNFEQLSGDEGPHLLDQSPPSGVCVVTMDNQREGVDLLAGHQDVELYELGFPVSGQFVVER